MRELGATRVTDWRGTMKQLPGAGKGLFSWYSRRYLAGDSRRVAPLIHLGLLCGGLGYYWEYPHLSMMVI